MNSTDQLRRRVGVVGGGQLARMLVPAALSLDVELVPLCSSPDDPVRPYCPTALLGAPDREGLRRLARSVEVLTIEHEGIDPDDLALLADEGQLVRPSPSTLRLAVDKSACRRALAAAGLPLPEHITADTVDEVGDFARSRDAVVLKTPTGGYDGRGVWFADGHDEAVALARPLGRPLLVEERIELAAEVAVMVARNASGATVTYPPVLTVQSEGICVRVEYPAPLDAELAHEATRLAVAVADELGAVGLLAVEMFCHTDGRLTINEVAARPHNSAHLTIEAFACSQFEQLLRAVLDLPLGSTRPLAEAAVMVNLLGPPDGSDPRARLSAALTDEVAVHLYGKQARPGRKLGHVTALASCPDEARRRATAAAVALGSPAQPSTR